MPQLKKGERRGGRTKGTPNRSSIEKETLARLDREAEEAAKLVPGSPIQRKKLGKEVLEEFMHLFAGIAASCQPLPQGALSPPGHRQDEKKFLTYAKLAVDTARDLADFQSPRYRAIAVAMAPNQDQPTRTEPGSNVVQISDPLALARVYQRRIQGVQG